MRGGRGVVVTMAACAIGALTMAPASVSGQVWSPPAKQSNAGDSISQGFGAAGFPFDDTARSWVLGTDPDVGSMFLRYRALNPAFRQEGESVSGAEMVGGDDNFPAQASRICAQTTRPNRVHVLLGGNDVCNRPRSSSSDAAANLYSVSTFRAALRAGLEQLATCLPPGAVVQVLSVPRVDHLYAAGRAKSLWCPLGIWPIAGICRVVTAEGSASRRAQIGARVDAYNDAIAAEVAAGDALSLDVDPEIVVVDRMSEVDASSAWARRRGQGHASTVVPMGLPSQAWSALTRLVRWDVEAREANAGRVPSRVLVATVDDRAKMEELVALGVDGIVTDTPALLREVRDGKAPGTAARTA